MIQFLATIENHPLQPQYAIKRITISSITDLEQQIKLILQVCNVERESMAMSFNNSFSNKLNNNNGGNQVHIVPHYDIFYKEYRNQMKGENEYILSIVMGYCDLGSLEDVIYNYNNEYNYQPISGELKVDWMIDITRTLVFFHKRKLVHLDIVSFTILS